MGYHDKHKKTYENEQYCILNGWAMSQEQLAAGIGVSVITLKKYYSKEINQSYADIINRTVAAVHTGLAEVQPSITTKMIDKIMPSNDTLNINHSGSIELNGYVDKPKDLDTDAWLKLYAEKKQLEIETVEAEEIEDAQ